MNCTGDGASENHDAPTPLSIQNHCSAHYPDANMLLFQREIVDTEDALVI